MKYFLFAIAVVLFACSEKHKEHNDEASDDVEWKEMDDFHAIMADVYHPLKDSNNLAPIKEHSGELAKSASDWASAKLPEKVNNDETKELLNQLNEGCKALYEMVKDKAPDEDISSKLSGLHDTFHSIMERWHQADKEEGSEEHHEHH